MARTRSPPPIRDVRKSPGLDPGIAASDLRSVTRSIAVQARRDPDAGVWIATSEDRPGLVVEADTWAKMMEETKLVLPERLALSGRIGDQLSLTFRAEDHLDLAGA